MRRTAGDRPGAATDIWVRSTFGMLTGLPGVHRVGLAFVEAGGRQLAFTASDRLGQDRAGWCEVDAYEDVPLNNTVRSGRLICGTLDGLAERYPKFVDRQDGHTQAIASVALEAAGQVLGGFALFYETRQPFDDVQLAELRRLGQTLGADLRRVRRTARPLASRALSEQPVPVGARVATRWIASDPAGVPGARHFARDTLTDWGIDEETRDAAVLCVSELVTNAIIHTRAGCELRLVLHRGVLTTSVRDGGSDADHLDGAAEDPLAVHGRGLQLVSALSARWGSQFDDVGMTVWCVLETLPD